MDGGLPSDVTSAAVSFLFVSGSDGWSAARRCLLPVHREDDGRGEGAVAFLTSLAT